jgi:hypothetical protein
MVTRLLGTEGGNVPKKKKPEPEEDLSPEKLQEFLAELTPNEMEALEKTLESARKTKFTGDKDEDPDPA